MVSSDVRGRYKGVAKTRTRADPQVSMNGRGHPAELRERVPRRNVRRVELLLPVSCCTNRLGQQCQCQTLKALA